MAQKPEQYPLYYITHINNLRSILEHGILSHNVIGSAALSYLYERIDHESVNNLRASRYTPDGRSLWDYANLYFQPRNAMLYRLCRSYKTGEIVVLQIDPAIMYTKGVYITDGNAASEDTKILSVPEGLKRIRQIKKVFHEEYWDPYNHDGSKRKMMAECLIPDQVEANAIKTIYVPEQQNIARVTDIAGATIAVVADMKLFFRPDHTIEITPKLHLVQGDMFFSFAQTLTISVNTQGVMGKGLAARAKYQFPDVYVVYQDACRGRAPKIRPGVPYLYKRESSLDLELADNSRLIAEPNDEKWFLLFPTKRHWREHSNLDDITKGLEWIQNNYQQEGITSLALPALGCGLGNLAWADVGPLMCQFMADLRIPVRIYLPRETDTHIPVEQLTRAFLLGR